MKQLMTIGLLISAMIVSGQSVTLKSPDNQLEVQISIGKELQYQVHFKGDTLLYPSAIGMETEGGPTWGKQSKLLTKKYTEVHHQLAAEFYKKDSITDEYHQFELVFKEGFSVVFRAFNTGLAYRFVAKAGPVPAIKNELVAFNFGARDQAYICHVRGQSASLESQFHNSFENTYLKQPISQIDSARLIMLPLLVETAKGTKICITEADLEDYPGLSLKAGSQAQRLSGVLPPCPGELVQGGHNNLQLLVKSRLPVVAKSRKVREFPWRVIGVADNDKTFPNSDLVYQLSAPSRIRNTRWIRPGKVAWDWWNDWGIYQVDFKAGVNNQTYKYYIDFASEKKLQYVILDEGWSVKNKADLLQVVPSINIPELVEYAKSRNVDIILWAGYYALERNMDSVMRYYSAMGVKGFKVDFVDRDDQLAVKFYYDVARTAATHQLIVDFHGAYKPTGLHRTYPNVLNFEGVFGLEQMKGPDGNVDMVTHDVTIPFIRMFAGPLDYTQGAMRNAAKKEFYPSNSQPMSQGTRCRQLAEYVVFESPLNMMCDNPTVYKREMECTNFISAVPVVWNETICMDGKVSEYIAMARRSGKQWWVGAMTNWTPRDLTLNLSFLGDGDYIAEIFKDGVNAVKIATDYKREIIHVGSSREIKIDMAAGGGWAARFYRSN